jgi:murein DD-endopeptidase MepM/ murein hydrolase activator NlpD
MKQSLAGALLMAGLASSAGAGMDTASPAMPVQTYVLKRGGTLDGLLSKAGLDAQERFEVARGLSAELDPGLLQPGLVLEVAPSGGGTPEALTFVLKDQARLTLDPEQPDKVTRIEPKTETQTEAGEITVGLSVYAALEEAGIPAHFAADLDRIFGTTVDFRRDIQGGETVQMIWTRDVNEAGETIGSAELSYAALIKPGGTFEAVWPGTDAARLAVFHDDKAVRVYTPPVTGARISSGFGMRRHPVLGTRRLHAGVDFAAPTGTPVNASAAGTVSFAGRRGGYGNMVEISHGGAMTTRYAHLSSIAAGIRKGSRVDADTLIGKVGSTGLSTGPHLHYEVHLDGKPVDPLSDARLADLGSGTAAEDKKALQIKRAQFRRLQNATPELPVVLPPPDASVPLG